MGGRDWINLLETFGVTTVILIFVGVCIWQGFGWIASNVVTRVVDEFIQLLDALIASIVKQGDALAKVGEVMETLCKTMETLGTTMDHIGNHALREMEILDRIHSGVANLQKVNTVTIKEANNVDITPRQKG